MKDVPIKKRVVWLVLVVLGVGLIFWFGGSGVFVGERQNQNDNSVEVGIWTANDTFEQTFIALHPNLSRVDFWLDSYHPWSSPYLECRLFEIETTEKPSDLAYDVIRGWSQEVRFTQRSGWLLSGHMANSCSFDPIPDSQGRRYLISLRFPVVKKGGSSILQSSSQDRYDEGNLFVNGEKRDTDLAFRVLYQRSRLQLLQNAVARIILQKPFPFSQIWFAYLLFVFYFSLVSLLIYSCFRKKRES